MIGTLKRVSFGLNRLSAVMPALVAGIHVYTDWPRSKDVDGRNKSGHDVERAWFDLNEHAVVLRSLVDRHSAAPQSG